MKLFNKIKKIALWSFVGLAAVIGLLILVNAFDEKLDPGIVAFSEINKASARDVDNAYYAVVMLHSDPKLDISGVHAKGVKWVEAMNEAISSNAFKEEGAIAASLDDEGLVFKGDSDLIRIKPAINGQEPVPELKQLLDVKGELPGLVKANRTLLDRYLALYRYRAYSVALKPTADGAILSLENEQGLAHANVALMLEAGNKGAAIRLLTDDLLFWRRVLKGSRSYFDRPVIVAAIWRDLVFLNDLLNAYSFTKSELSVAEQALRPMGRAELDNVTPAVDNFNVGRYAISAFADGSTEGISAWKYYLLRPFFSPNATINTLYRHQAMLAEFAKFTPRQQVEALRARRIPRMFGPSDKAPGWTIFYNPVGNTVLGSGAQSASYNRYSMNLEGLMRLTTLCYLMKRANVKKGEVEKYVAHAGHNYFDPYTDAEMRWDDDKKAIYFYGMDRHGEPAKRIELVFKP